jgi:hypothetical protein
LSERLTRVGHEATDIIWSAADADWRRFGAQASALAADT